MPRYMVERIFPDGLDIPANDDGAATCLAVVERNADVGVTWVHSYVSEDRRKTYCIYDSHDVTALQRAAERNRLPVEAITRVQILSPYLYL